MTGLSYGSLCVRGLMIVAWERSADAQSRGSLIGPEHWNLYPTWPYQHSAVLTLLGVLGSSCGLQFAFLIGRGYAWRMDGVLLNCRLRRSVESHRTHKEHDNQSGYGRFAPRKRWSHCS